MLLLMLFSSLVLVLPLSIFSSTSAVTPALAFIMLDQVVRLPGAPASLSEQMLLVSSHSVPSGVNCIQRVGGS